MIQIAAQTRSRRAVQRRSTHALPCAHRGRRRPRCRGRRRLAGRSRAHRTSPVPERSRLHVLHAHRSARPLRPPTRNASAGRRGRRQRAGTTWCAAAPDGRPGPARSTGARACAGDRRGRAEGLPNRDDRPAGHGRRRARLFGAAGGDGQLGPRPAACRRRPRLRVEARRPAAVLRHGRCRRRPGVAAHGARCRPVGRRRHLVRHLRRRAVRTGASPARLEARPRLGRPSPGGDRSGRGRVSRRPAGAARRLRQQQLLERSRCVRPHDRQGAGDLRRADVRKHRRPVVPLLLRPAAAAPRCGGRSARRSCCSFSPS